MIPAFSVLPEDVRLAWFIVVLTCKRVQKPLPKMGPLPPEWDETASAIQDEDLVINADLGIGGTPR